MRKRRSLRTTDEQRASATPLGQLPLTVARASGPRSSPARPGTPIPGRITEVGDHCRIAPALSEGSRAALAAPLPVSSRLSRRPAGRGELVAVHTTADQQSEPLDRIFCTAPIGREHRFAGSLDGGMAVLEPATSRLSDETTPGRTAHICEPRGPRVLEVGTTQQADAPARSWRS
jgi:hypothetical protein